MPFYTKTQGSLEYLGSQALTAPHAFTTRRGGCSTGYLESLNLGTNRGDSPENVLRNYEILGSALGFSPADTVFTRQTHSAIVARVGRADRGQGLFAPVPGERDGLITNEPGVVLTVFSADCTPVLLHDPVHRAVGAVHAGWRGTAGGIAAKAVEAMTSAFGTRPEDIQAAIGPCIGPCCFETGEDVPAAMVKALGEEALPAIAGNGPKYHVNLKQLNEIWLRRAGVVTLEICPDCTACQNRRFWSHRVVGDHRGSLAAVIWLPEGDRP